MVKNEGKVRGGRTFRAQFMFNSNVKPVFQSAGGRNRERKRGAKRKAFSTILSAKERHLGSVKESPRKARAREGETQRERHKTRRQHRETKDCKNTEKCAMKCSIYTKDISTHACMCVCVCASAGMATYDSCHVTVFSSNSNESWVRLWNREIRKEQSEKDDARTMAEKRETGLTVAGRDYQVVNE